MNDDFVGFAGVSRVKRPKDVVVVVVAAAAAVTISQQSAQATFTLTTGYNLS